MKPIVLDSNYTIVKDTYSWKLKFQEDRMKLSKETGLEEPFIFEDQWFYPDLKQVMNKYVDLTLKQSNSVKEMKATLDKVYDSIKNLQKTIFKK